MTDFPGLVRRRLAAIEHKSSIRSQRRPLGCQFVFHAASVMPIPQEIKEE